MIGIKYMNNQNNNIIKGLISKIESGAVHDGEGIRTLIFMKGCPLHCEWCANPETQKNHPEISYNQELCIGCFRCIKECPLNAIKVINGKKIYINRGICDNCGKCADVCPTKALTLIGEYMDIDEVVKIIEEESVFYYRSNGGVTISGGEPLLQYDFVSKLLKKCQSRGLNTAIETCGFSLWENAEKVFKYTDFVFYDIKMMDENKHRKYTGVDNKIILENIIKLSNNFPQTPIVVRTPIIPGINDSEECIKKITRFITTIKSVIDYELLFYHKYGLSKYSYLGRKYKLDNINPPTKESKCKLINYVNDFKKGMVKVNCT